MKKVLFVTESLGRGGMERVLVDISNALVSRGFDVTIITYDKNAPLRVELNERVHYCYKARRDWKILRRIPYIRWRYNKQFKKYQWETNASARSLYKYYVGYEKYDVEIAFYRGPSIKIVSGSPNKKSKKIAWVHTDFKLCDPRGYTLFFQSIDEVKAAYKKFQHIVCVSEMAKKSFGDVIGCSELCTVIYNMVPIANIRKKADELAHPAKRKFTIATLGRLIPDKGYDRLLNAVYRLNQDGYDFDLWIIGGGREEDNLKKQSEILKLDNVIFWGMQSNPYYILAEADVFVCSSIREGFAIAVVEAMAFGVPVLSTKCTGPIEILANGEYGILVDCSEEGIYSGLRDVLNNPESLAEYRQKSMERCLYFDESKIIDQIIDLINQ